MSDSWVRDRMQAGELPRPGQTAEEYVQAFVELRTRRITGSQEGGGGLDAEKTRLTREQADRVAMQNAVDRKELASLSSMTLAVTNVISVAVGRLMLIPDKVAGRDIGLRRRIEVAINDALKDLSVARVEEAVGGGADGEEPEGEDAEAD